MEEKNRNLHVELQEIVQETDEVNEHVLEILKKHHAVSHFSDLRCALIFTLQQVFEQWLKAPLDDIEAWVVQTADLLKPVPKS